MLHALSRERTALVKARFELQNRRDTITSPVLRKIKAQTLAALTMQIEKIDKGIKTCGINDEDLLAEVHIMTTMQGVNFVSAYKYPC